MPTPRLMRNEGLKNAKGTILWRTGAKRPKLNFRKSCRSYEPLKTSGGKNFSRGGGRVTAPTLCFGAVGGWTFTVNTRCEIYTGDVGRNVLHDLGGEWWTRTLAGKCNHSQLRPHAGGRKKNRGLRNAKSGGEVDGGNVTTATERRAVLPAHRKGKKPQVEKNRSSKIREAIPRKKE